MIPRISRKLAFLKSSSVASFPVQTLSVSNNGKTTKHFRPLAISASSGIQKPKRLTVNKFSPLGKLQPRRPNEYLVKLNMYYYQRKTSAFAQPQSQPEPQLPPPVKSKILFPAALKLIRKAKVQKKAAGKREEKQMKRKLKQRLQQRSLLEISSSSTSITRQYPPAPTTVIKVSESTPAKTTSTATSKHFVGKNGRLRGSNSKFATPDFDASKPKTYLADSPGKYKDSMEAHLEMKMEVVIASTLAIYDFPTPHGWARETLAGRFSVEVAAHRRKMASMHLALREHENKDMEMHLDFVDIRVPVLSAPAPASATASVPFQGRAPASIPGNKARKILAPPPGARRAKPMALVTIV